MSEHDDIMALLEQPGFTSKDLEVARKAYNKALGEFSGLRLVTDGLVEGGYLRPYILDTVTGKEYRFFYAKHGRHLNTWCLKFKTIRKHSSGRYTQSGNDRLFKIDSPVLLRDIALTREKVDTEAFQQGTPVDQFKQLLAYEKLDKIFEGSMILSDAYGQDEIKVSSSQTIQQDDGATVTYTARLLFRSGSFEVTKSIDYEKEYNIRDVFVMADIIDAGFDPSIGRDSQPVV